MAKASSDPNSKKKKKTPKPAKITYHKRPEKMDLDLWQYKLRQVFGEENEFLVEGDLKQTFFTEYAVYNPASKNTYRTVISAGLPRRGLPVHNSLIFRNNHCNCQDFRTNQLGICKHISATLHFLSKKRGFKAATKQPFRPESSGVYVDYRIGPKVRLLVGSEKEEAILEWSEKWFDEEGYFILSCAPLFDMLLQEAREILPVFFCEDDALELVLGMRENIRRKAMLRQVIGPEALKSNVLKNLLKVPLFPYQMEGIRYAADAGRCIIADEMGLGKTIQAIGAAALLREYTGIEKVVVVCPSSLKYQWKMEIEKFSGLSVNVVEGGLLKRRSIYKENTSFFQVVSYNVATNDSQYLAEMKADMLIIDEAQRLKNFRTKVSAEVKKIITPYCVVLTGTPLENKIEELYAVTQFVDQYRFPPLYRFLDRYQISSETGQIVGYQNLKEISEVMSACMIRRRKKEVWKQLPDRVNKTLYVPMTQQQREIHNELADQVAQLVAKWQKYHYLSEQDRHKLILFLSQMRMVCDSTFILDQKSRHDTKIEELLFIFEEALADPDQKIVVFSQWERMTRLVAAELEKRDTGYANLNGSVPSKDRQALLERFTNDPECRVFLSTDAGATGLNLQVASILINLDIPWNPALLEQRVGRIFRIGQERSISVINMVSSGTIEERMLGVLAFKKSMAEGVLDPEGDDTIVMSESRFKKFMETVEGVAEQGWSGAEFTDETAPAAGEISDVEDVEKSPEAAVLSSDSPGESKQKTAAPVREIPGDDDVAVPGTSGDGAVQRIPAPADKTPSTAISSVAAKNTGERQSAQQLVQTGVSFLNSLSETLRSPEKTQELIQSVVEKDEATGQTYLKIPVENAAVVQNVMQLLGKLFV